MRQLKGIDDTEPVIGTITSEQSVSVPVTGMQLTATTGLLECGFTAALGAGTVSETYTALLTSPVRGPGEFRRAIATASLAGIGYEQTAEAIGSSGFNCSITNVTAHLDDESGRIELAVAVRAEGFGGGSPTLISIGVPSDYDISYRIAAAWS